MQELLADEVVLLAGERGERGDLLGDALLLVERERHRLPGITERRLRRFDGRDRDLVVRVEQELDDHHRVVPLFDRLPVEVRGQERQRLGVEPDRDRDVLLRSSELVRDLFVQLLGEARHQGTTLSGV